MLDIKLIRKEKEKIEALIQRKEPEITLDKVFHLDEKIRNKKTESENLKSKRNSLSKVIGEKKKGNEKVDDLMKEVRDMGDKITSLDHELIKLEEEFNFELSKIPNIPEEDVKVSLNKEDNVLVKSVGEQRAFAFTPKNHVELNEKLHLFNFDRTSITSGSGWPAYRGLGARLEWALLSYMIDMQILNGFEFWLPPLLVRPEILYGSGQIPKFIGQFYQLNEPNKENDLYLIPTAEVVLNGLHFDEIIDEEKLPIKYAAYTPCFRKEAGAAGATERGLIRVHQFNKVEMFCFCKKEQNNDCFEHMLNTAEEILKGLDLHYRLMDLVTGDMSFTAARTIDIEVYIPGQKRYYEVSSVSKCTDYQSRRSNIRYKGKGNSKTEFVYTLNGSGLATSRLFVALLENFQNPDGSVTLPPVLAEKLGVHKLDFLREQS